MRTLKYRQAICEALQEEMRADPQVVLLGQDVGPGGPFGTSVGLLEEFGPARVRNAPCSETAFLGAAIGASLMGLRPVAEISFNDFLLVCFDQLGNQAAKMAYMSGGQLRLPLVVSTFYGGGRSSGAQHSQSLEALVAHVPGLKLAMPSCPADAKGLLKAALRDDNPVVVFQHKALLGLDGAVPEGDHVVPLGNAEVKRGGDDVTIVATGAMVGRALAAADVLEGEGISVEVVDPRTLVPLDRATIIASVQKTSRAVVVHEAVKFGGFGAEIAAVISEEAFHYLDAPVKRVAAPFAPVPYSPGLERAYLPDEAAIVAAVKEVLGFSA